MCVVSLVVVSVCVYVLLCQNYICFVCGYFVTQPLIILNGSYIQKPTTRTRNRNTARTNNFTMRMRRIMIQGLNYYSTRRQNQKQLKFANIHHIFLLHHNHQRISFFLFGFWSLWLYVISCYVTTILRIRIWIRIHTFL